MPWLESTIGDAFRRNNDMVSSHSVVLWLRFGASMVSTAPPSTGEEEHHEGTAMAPSATPPGGPRPQGLIQRYREELQSRHYARRTVETYEQWLRRFLRFHQLRHPREMGSNEVNAFLTHLAVEGQVSASTQNQILWALLFLYRELLERDLDLEGVIRAKRPPKLPVVITVAEVRACWSGWMAQKPWSLACCMAAGFV
jgi:hypothetical protein